MTAPALTHADKLELKRRMAEKCAALGIALGDTSGPGQLAMRHDPRQTVARPHLRVIDDALTHLLATPNGKLMIFTPPQVGKSTRVSRWFPFWWLTMRPADKVVLACYADSLAQGHGGACRNLVAAYGHQYGLFLSPTQNTKTEWELTAGGGMRSVGVRGGLTGKSMDLGIIDDPLSGRAQAESDLIRNGVWDWYSGTYLSRNQPSTRHVLVMTRWHPDDLAGRILKEEGRIEEGGDWKVVHLPAVAVAPDHEKGFYADPLGREPGEPLSHPKIPDPMADPEDVDELAELVAHWNRQRKTSTARDWNAMYQGSPFDAEGTLLSATEIRDATLPPELDTNPSRRVGVGVDPSGGGRDEAGIIGGRLDSEGRFIFTHDRTAKMASDMWAREACLLAYETDATRIVFEKNYGGDMPAKLIAQAWKALQEEEGVIPITELCPLIVGVQSRVSKVLRAEPIAQAVKTKRVWFAPGLQKLTGEWQMWQPGSKFSPGSLDAGVHLATDMLPTIPRGARTTNPARKRKSDARATGIAARRRAG